jgi:hypothetical protein
MLYSIHSDVRRQIQELGVSAAELVRLACQPITVMPGPMPKTQRIAGYGLVALVADGTVMRVIIDGATGDNLHEWAVERAEFGDGDVTGADTFVKQALGRTMRRDPVMPSPRRKRAELPVFPVEVRRIEPVTAPPVAEPIQPVQSIQPEHLASAVETDGDILSRIHPALRAEITRQADGDLSRVVIESFTRVSILPR